MARQLTNQEEQVHAALVKAAERIGANAYKAGHYKVKRNRKGVVVQGYTLTPEHQEVMTAIDALGRGTITAEEGMAILHQYEVHNARIKGY
jgi:hypothetical protein